MMYRFGECGLGPSWDKGVKGRMHDPVVKTMSDSVSNESSKVIYMNRFGECGLALLGQRGQRSHA